MKTRMRPIQTNLTWTTINRRYEKEMSTSGEDVNMILEIFCKKTSEKVFRKIFLFHFFKCLNFYQNSRLLSNICGTIKVFSRDNNIKIKKKSGSAGQSRQHRASILQRRSQVSFSLKFIYKKSKPIKQCRLN
jgi:hypothetical protein